MISVNPDSISQLLNTSINPDLLLFLLLQLNIVNLRFGIGTWHLTGRTFYIVIEAQGMGLWVPTSTPSIISIGQVAQPSSSFVFPVYLSGWVGVTFIIWTGFVFLCVYVAWRTLLYNWRILLPHPFCNAAPDHLYMLLSLPSSLISLSQGR